MRSSRSGGVGFLMGLGVLLVAVVIVVGLAAPYLNVQEQTSCLVEDKDRTRDSEGNSDMRIYTSCGVFQVKDQLLRGSFNSADVYADIEVGQEYDFVTSGFRIPIASQFPVIVEVK